MVPVKWLVVFVLGFFHALILDAYVEIVFKASYLEPKSYLEYLEFHP